MLAEGLLIHIGKTRFFQSKMACRAAIDHAQFRQPDLVDAGLEAAAQADGVSAIADQRKVVALLRMPLAEVVLCRRDGQRQQQAETDDAECPHRIAEQGPPRRGKKLSYRLHLTPPRQNPGPAWAAEPCAHRGEHN